jgi:coenzyme F420-dependent glucose-6-phosphate dehydrogenase
MRYGYKASAEQFGPRELLDFSVLAEEAGLGTVAISDHFQPWRHHGGHGPNALVWLGSAGERTSRALLGTSVLTPTLRYQPAVVAQAFATLACLNPGRVFLGVGTGEAMNERPVTGQEWPGAKERRLRLREAIELIRALWTRERVDFDGEFYRTEKATVYDRPDQPVPIYVAASGPLAARLAGRLGDGFICTSGKAPELYEELTAKVGEGAEAAGRDASAIDRMIEIKVSYDRDLGYARDACAFWAALALTPEEKTGIEDPVDMERAADAAIDRAPSRFIVSDDPDEVVERIAPYVDLGFRHLVFHAPGEDQARFLDAFAQDVLPRLRARFGEAADAPSPAIA